MANTQVKTVIARNKQMLFVYWQLVSDPHHQTKCKKVLNLPSPHPIFLPTPYLCDT